MYSGVVNLRLHLPFFDVCWRFGVAGLGWYLCSRLKHNWSVHVKCGDCGLMTVFNRVLISPRFCSGMSLPSRWRDAENLLLYRTHDQCGDTIEKLQAYDD